MTLAKLQFSKYNLTVDEQLVFIDLQSEIESATTLEELDAITECANSALEAIKQNHMDDTPDLNAYRIAIHDAFSSFPTEELDESKLAEYNEIMQTIQTAETADEIDSALLNLFEFVNNLYA